MRALSRLPLLLCLLATSTAAPRAETPIPATPGANTDAALGVWLDEVRAQREAWEARRKAATAASNARLRLIDPWGAAQFEALDRETEIRRESARERAELRRKSTEAHHRSLDQLREEKRKMLNYYVPYGWDNPWYYRGY